MCQWQDSRGQCGAVPEVQVHLQLSLCDQSSPSLLAPGRLLPEEPELLTPNAPGLLTQLVGLHHCSSELKCDVDSAGGSNLELPYYFTVTFAWGSQNGTSLPARWQPQSPGFRAASSVGAPLLRPAHSTDGKRGHVGVASYLWPQGGSITAV